MKFLRRDGPEPGDPTTVWGPEVRPRNPDLPAEMADGSVMDALIFIVDDTEANVVLLDRILGAAGFTRRRGITDSREVVEAVRAEHPDLILLDIRMPHLDGFEVMEALAAAPDLEPLPPILILTAELDQATRRRGLAAGARDFLNKPFDPGEVLLRCVNLLETHLLQRRLSQRNAELETDVVVSSEALEVERQDRERVAASLARLSALPADVSAAGAICEETARLGRFDRVALIGFAAVDRATVLAEHGASGPTTAISRRLEPSIARYLHDHAALGAWTESPARVVDAEYSRRLAEAGIRTAIYAPVRDGQRLVGLLGAGSHAEQPAAETERLLSSVIACAAMTGALLGPTLGREQEEGETRDRIAGIIEAGAFAPVYQPIVDVESRRVVGHEALSRFDDGTRPDLVFADAGAVGLGVELETATLSKALAGAAELPPAAWLSINVSPALVLDRRRLGGVLHAQGLPVVLEITEHQAVTDYEALRSAIAELGGQVRLAIDDAGAGFSSLRHIIEMGPQFVKLDMSLIRGLDHDPARQALVAGMVHFAGLVDCTLIAEGVETEEELAALRALSVPLAQGYLLGRPAPATTQPVATLSRAG